MLTIISVKNRQNVSSEKKNILEYDSRLITRKNHISIG